MAQETAPEAVEATSGQADPAPKRGFLQWMANLLRSNSNVQEQFEALNESIQQNPQAPTAYVLRGELHLKQKQYALARVDFERAVALTDEQFEEAQWGIVAQAMRERAERGLSHRRVAHLNSDV